MVEPAPNNLSHFTNAATPSGIEIVIGSKKGIMSFRSSSMYTACKDAEPMKTNIYMASTMRTELETHGESTYLTFSLDVHPTFTSRVGPTLCQMCNADLSSTSTAL